MDSGNQSPEDQHEPAESILTREGERTMNNEILFVAEESPEGGYEARALGHAIFTEAETFDDLKRMIQDAVRVHFEEAERPRIIRVHFVREEVLSA